MVPSHDTVIVEPIEGHNALKMLWQHQIERDDVNAAFQSINAYLNRSDAPVFVLVNLLQNPQFPLRETIFGALMGPYKHVMLAEWLFVGSSAVARTIERTLASMTGRKNVRWFDTEAEATAYLVANSRRIDAVH